jgi:hypothetical protein
MTEEQKNNFKNLSIEKIMEIQLALKQLGYEIKGYRFNGRGEIVIRLREIYPFVRIDTSGNRSIVDNVDEILAIENS